MHYRYGYQGQFAEMDTGWNHFELREYDAVIGRWLVPDPAREFFSPYAAYGNDPINKVDPDGGCTDCPGSSVDGFSFSVGFSAYRNQERAGANAPTVVSMLTSFGSGVLSSLSDTWQGLKHEFTWEGTLDRINMTIDPAGSMLRIGKDVYGAASQLAEDVPNWDANDWSHAGGYVSGVVLQAVALKRLSIYRVKWLRVSGGEINGFSISRGAGYGAKPRFDVHPLKYPSSPGKQLNLPEFLKNGKTWVPHYHRKGPGGIRRHRPFESSPGDKSWRDRF